jgi:1-acyl-sn-glycerol-3-phosphate acyltransferase
VSYFSDRLSDAFSDRLGDRWAGRVSLSGLKSRLPRRLSAFPWAAPTWPTSLPMPPPDSKTGSDFETAWSRRYGVRLARAALLDSVVRPLVYSVIPPVVEGYDRLEGVKGPVIFAANHHSHLDTPLLLSVLPARFRHRTVVVGAADYFFDTRWKGALFAFTLAAIPIERRRVSRKFLDLASELLEDGWNILIYPEGGRSPDGWGQSFTAETGYLSVRNKVPFVPLHVAGTSRVLPKGAGRLRPGPTAVTFGHPLSAGDGEDARRLTQRLEREVAALADEFHSDWWQARRRAAVGNSPSLSGPGPEVAPWRRAWAKPVPDRDRRGVPGKDSTPWSRR